MEEVVATDLNARLLDWLDQADSTSAVRKTAIDRLRKDSWPGRKTEEWKYTPLRRLLHPELDIKRGHGDDIRGVSFYPITSNRLVFVNGAYDVAKSVIEDEMLSVSPLEMDDAILGMDGIDQEPDFALYLNRALCQHGVAIHVPAGARLQFPIEFIYINTADRRHWIDNPRHHIDIGAEANASFLISHHNLAQNDASLTNACYTVLVGQAATVDWTVVQDKANDDIQCSNVYTRLQRDARWKSCYITLSGRLNRNLIRADLLGEGAESRYYGLYLLNGEDRVDNRTTVDHAVPNCFSDELYKGILDGHSTGVFNGKVIVRPDAQKTNAFQHNPNILLSDDAEIYTKPQLEIFADDVKCSHGATIGGLDPEMLFYLRSRGLGKQDARHLLTYAFASGITSTLDIPEVRDMLSERLAQALSVNLA